MITNLKCETFFDLSTECSGHHQDKLIDDDQSIQSIRWQKFLISSWL